MYIKNGIAYAVEQKPLLSVVGVRPLPDHRLWVRFMTGETRQADLRPLLGFPCYAPIKDESNFNSVYIDYGVVTWMDGRVDISPEYLYSISTPTGTSPFSPGWDAIEEEAPDEIDIEMIREIQEDPDCSSFASDEELHSLFKK